MLSDQFNSAVQNKRQKTNNKCENVPCLKIRSLDPLLRFPCTVNLLALTNQNTWQQKTQQNGRAAKTPGCFSAVGVNPRGL